jgi:outer membrane protein TolC
MSMSTQSWLRACGAAAFTAMVFAPLAAQPLPRAGRPIPVSVDPPAPLPNQPQAVPPVATVPTPVPAPIPAAAVPPPSSPIESNTFPIDLPTALRLAGAENPTVNAARARYREAVANYDRARLMWIPNLTFGPSFFYHEGVDQNRRGEIFSVARGNVMLNVGPTLRVDVADAIFMPLVARRGVQSADSRSQAVGNEMQLLVALAYLDLLEVHALLAINADTLMRAEQVLAAAESGAKAGLNKTAADVNRAATEVRLRLKERTVLRGRAGAVSARLNQLLMLDAAVELTPMETAVVPVVMVHGDLTIRQLIQTAVRFRPEMHAATAELDASETLVKHARTSPLLPRIQADFIGGGLSGGLNDQFSPMRGQYNAFVGAAWELDNFGFGNAAEVRARRAGYETAQFRLQEVQAQVSAEVVEAARTSAARFGSLGDAQEAVRQAQEMYRKFRDIQFGMIGPKGQFDSLELLTAVQALNQARIGYLEQVVEFNRSQFRLFAAIGQPAVSGIEGAATQPLSVPVVPPPAPIVPAILNQKP